MNRDGFDLPHAFTAAIAAELIVVLAIFMGAAVLVNIGSIFQ